MDLLHLKQNIAPDPLALEVDLEIGCDMLTLPRIVVGKRIGVSWLMYGSQIAGDGLHELCGWSFMHRPALNKYPVIVMFAVGRELVEQLSFGRTQQV